MGKHKHMSSISLTPREIKQYSVFLAFNGEDYDITDDWDFVLTPSNDWQQQVLGWARNLEKGKEDRVQFVCHGKAPRHVYHFISKHLPFSSKTHHERYHVAIMSDYIRVTKDGKITTFAFKNPANEDIVRFVAEKFPGLDGIGFPFCATVTNEGISALVRNSPSLRAVIAPSSHINEHGVRLLLSSCPIKGLSVKSCSKISDGSLDFLMEYQPSILKGTDRRMFSDDVLHRIIGDMPHHKAKRFGAMMFPTTRLEFEQKMRCK